MLDASPLVRYLRREPGLSAALAPEDWSQLVRDAQRNKLLSRIASLLDADGGLAHAPENIQRKLRGALRTGKGSARSVLWEVGRIAAALGASDIPFVLLKGAAYEMCRLEASRGRLYVDIDIMVPHDRLDEAERELFKSGWHSTKLDAYDQKYYRTWMHEIPPMRNLERNTFLDVHHTVLPPTAKLRPDPALLWGDALEVPGWSGVLVLAPADMVLHSAVHLFHDGDLAVGLRDLVDLDSLLRQFSREPGFWPELLHRAQALDLVKPLFFALRYTQSMLATPVDVGTLEQVAALGSPAAIPLRAMDLCVPAALDPTRDNLDSRSRAFLRWLLYVRSHYLRMPLGLLVPHLLRKALKPDPAE